MASLTPAGSRTLSAARIYAFYEGLYASGRQLGGSLLLYEGLDEAGRIAALAGNIAGVATLGIDSNSAALKQAVNDGVCDFLVNNLDEALRILKNEIRKKQPVSVCLSQEFGAAVGEIVERGLQPDFLAVEQPSAAVDVLRTRGAMAVLPHEGQGVGVAYTASTSPTLWLPKIDAIAASVLDSADDKRQRWLRFASRYLGRLTGGTHFLRMTNSEATAFRVAIEGKIADGTIACAVRIVIDDEEVSIEA